MVVYLVRHGVAVAKQRWLGPDHHRPLTGRGLAQAIALEHWLPEPVSTVLSSPTLRCVATVLGVAARQGVPLRTDAALRVGRGAEAVCITRALLAEDGDAVVCTHGEVIPGLLAALAPRTASAPLERCAKGSVWVLRQEAGGLDARYLPGVPDPPLDDDLGAAPG